MLKNFFIVGFGSFFGGGFRFFLSKYIQNRYEKSFPFGTFFVNILGCLLIGLFYGLFDHGNIINPDYMLFLTVGICGGFTTFSTFMNENFQLFKAANYFHFSMYIISSVSGGLFAVYLGHLITKLI
jgi:fluoride exporter